MHLILRHAPHQTTERAKRNRFGCQLCALRPGQTEREGLSTFDGLHMPILKRKKASVTREAGCGPTRGIDEVHDLQDVRALAGRRLYAT